MCVFQHKFLLLFHILRSMVEDNRSTEEKIRLLQNAARVHQKLYRDCMSAKGCDRHMFALYVACKGLGYVSISIEFISMSAKGCDRHMFALYVACKGLDYVSITIGVML